MYTVGCPISCTGASVISPSVEQFGRLNYMYYLSACTCPLIRIIWLSVSHKTYLFLD